MSTVGFRIDVYHHLALEDSNKILAALGNLEIHMSKQDDAINAFKTDTDAKFAALGTSLDTMASAQANIAADEANILSQLQNLDGLSPANQATLDGITASLQGVVERSSAAATSLQTLADSIPDVQT